MGVKAIGFHESISVDRLAELFRSDLNQLFATSTVAHCKKCAKPYAVFLQQIDDPENGPYIAEIERVISNGCEGGTHDVLEIRLEINP